MSHRTRRVLIIILCILLIVAFYVSSFVLYAKTFHLRESDHVPIIHDYYFNVIAGFGMSAVLFTLRRQINKSRKFLRGLLAYVMVCSFLAALAWTALCIYHGVF